MESITAQNMDHHGIVAAIGRNLGIIEKVNKRLFLQNREENISRGQSVMAMIINGLGFTEKRLYMVADFFRSKPVELLLGKGVTADKLNDDNLGRTLDAIHQYGTSKFFSEIAFEIGLEHNAISKSAHLDTTSLSVEGEYNTCTPENETTINITHGHSKDHRPDLKQLVLSLTTTGDSSFPIWLEALSGNSSDKSSFIKTINSVKAFSKQMKNAKSFMWVADSAMYTKKKLLAQKNEISWLTRVPETIKEAKNHIVKNDEEYDWIKLENGYSVSLLESNYGDVKQRWFLYFSEQAYKKEIKTFKKNQNKRVELLPKKIKKAEKEIFSCKKDADKAFKKFCISNSYFNFDYSYKEVFKNSTGKKGRPSQQDRTLVGHSLVINCTGQNDDKIKKEKNSKGRFILATNELDKNKMPDEKILSEYKAQSKTENSFRFIKDPSFMLSDVYLKKPERIEALMAIMGLALMIYNVGQYHLRKILKECNESVPNQVGKEITNPTLKWIFQFFKCIVVLKIESGGITKTIITNLTNIHKKIIGFFGKIALDIYGLLNHEELQKLEEIKLHLN